MNEHASGNKPWIFFVIIMAKEWINLIVALNIVSYLKNKL